MVHKFNEGKNKSKSNFENNKVIKAASVVGIATLFSRITGYIRDMVFASFFGIGMVSDAFIAAFRIPNLLRRLLGEGSLSLAFIPVFTHYISMGQYESAYKLASRSLRILFFCLFSISLIGVILTPLILGFSIPGFTEFPLKMKLTIKLTRIMFPYIIFVGMLALCTGILNVLGNFAVPSFAPVLLNLSMIGSLYLGNILYSTQESLIVILSLGVLLGGFLQLIFQIPSLVRNGISLWESSGIWHPGFVKIISAMIPTIFGSAVYQINILIGTLLASFLAEGSIACLYYADRIVQFPLGIFAYALATAILPSLSRQISSGDHDAIGEIFAYTINILFFLTIPAMIGLIVLRQPIVELLFARGAFDRSAVLLTSDAVLFYAIGLWAFAAVRVVVSVFFAFRDTITPVKMATFSIIINIFFGIILMRSLGHCGLAFATSISSVINLIGLVYILSRKVLTIPWKKIIINILKTFFCSGIMALSVVTLKKLIIPTEGTSGVILFVALFLCIFVGVLIFILLAFSMKMSQISHIYILLSISKKNNQNQ